MTNETMPVVPGVDMSRALKGQRLTKKWLRDYLRDHPEKDFFNIGPKQGASVNGEDAVRFDLTLHVYDSREARRMVAIVDFQSAPDSTWGYQAVVH